MLLDIRETVRNSKPIKYTLITIIAIPFALVGIGSYLGGGGYEDVAEVDGEAISEVDLERAYSAQRQRISQMFGGSIPEGFISESAIREQALDQLVTSQVVRNTVADQKFAVGDTTLGRAIRNNPRFQVDGQFDKDTYELNLRSARMSVPQYEASLREETALNQFQAGIYGTSFTLPGEQAMLDELARQTRTIDFVRFSASEAMEKMDVSDDDIQAHFDDNASNYNFPERAKIEYIELSESELAKDIEVNDEDALAHYKEFKSRYVTPERREASHILLSVDDAEDQDEVATKTAELAAIKERIAAGESFAELATELSTDPGSADNGGSLGLISPGAMVPEFESAVYALENVGDISEPVASQFGVHLIKLDALTAEVGKPFEEVKEEVIASLQDERAGRRFRNLSEALQDAAFENPESLEVASENTGVSIKQSDWIDTDSTTDPMLSNPQLLAATFSSDVLQDGNNSDIVEVGNNHVVSLRVLEHEGPRPKTLEDVRDQVIDEIKRQRASEQLAAAADAAITAMKEGSSVVQYAEDNEFATGVENEVLTRQSTVIDSAAVSEIYAKAKPTGDEAVYGSSELQNGDFIGYALKSVAVPELSEDDEKPAPQVANPRLGQIELTALIDSLREQADISINTQ